MVESTTHLGDVSVVGKHRLEKGIDLTGTDRPAWEKWKDWPRRNDTHLRKIREPVQEVGIVLATVVLLPVGEEIGVEKDFHGYLGRL